MRPALVAMAFLTRLPVPGQGLLPDPVIGRAVGWFSWVGLLLGAGLALLGPVVGTWLPGLPGAALLLAGLALVTGALHLDGLADVFDALGAGGDRERRLDVMRDSRIGAHGATALLFGVLLKTSALATAGLDRPALLLAFPVVGRAVLSLLVVAFPYARPRGLGRTMKDHAGLPEVLLAAAPVALVVIAGGVVSVVAAAVGLVAALVMADRLNRQLGGLTGDVYGACLEVAETAYLLAAAALVVGAGW